MEVYVNSNDDITLTLPAGEHEPVTYTVYDGLTSVQTGTAERLVSINPSRERFGFNLTPSLETMDHRVKVVWSYTGGTKTDYVDVVTPYASIDEFLDRHPEYGPGGKKEKSIEQLKEAERAARTIINAFVGQSFGKWSNTIQVIGSGNGVVDLYSPVINIERMVSGTDLTGPNMMSNGLITMDGNSIIWQPRNAYEFATNEPVSYSTGETIYAPPVTRYGFKSGTLFTIKGIFGWDSVPNEINWCALQMMNDFFCREQIWRKRGAVSVRASDWRYEFNKAMINSTGDIDVDRVLSQFQQTRMSVI